MLLYYTFRIVSYASTLMYVGICFNKGRVLMKENAQLLIILGEEDEGPSKFIVILK